jgi:carbamoyltransferase
MSKILGLSFFYHDSGVALLVDGVPVAMAGEERFTGKKNDSSFPEKAIDFVLESTGTKKEEIDYVVFYEKPFLKLERIFKTILSNFPFSLSVFREAVKGLFIDKVWVRDLLSKKLGIDYKKVLFSEHHLAHAAASFLCSPYEKAAILTVDGVGEWAVTTIGLGEGNKIKILKEIHFPHSLGLLYSAFTAFLGFEINEGEYKVMGMAPYGTPKYIDKVRKLIKVFEDGSYELNLSYFSFQNSLSTTYSKKFVELFGSPRDKKSRFFTRNTGWPSYFGEKPQGEEYERLALEQEKYADIAASIQCIIEECLIGLAKEAQRITNTDKLCIGGGVALNSVANWKILQNTSFNGIFIQPAAGDAGGALGAALSVYNIALNGSRKFVMKHAYYGKEYSREYIEKFIKEKSLKAEYIENEDVLVDKVANLVMEGKVIGWFNGKFEWGPRALGSRSIIADPRREEMKDIVNTKIKFREPYRPFAPSVIAEGAEEFFEVPNIRDQYPARFMLYVVQVREDKKKVVPAITHVDGSARPQIVYREESPRYWKLINNFYQKTGVPLVLNTSFNLRGEPIVNTPEQALSTFERSQIDTLVLGDFIINK